MIIQSPADLASYLISIATQHRAVRHVVYGEHSRSESDTLAASQYPQVDIETPTVQIPPDQGPARMSTRIYVISSTTGGRIQDEDLTHDITYSIARDLINLICKHTDSILVDIELAAPVQIIPIVARGSDQQRGWMFSLEFLVDNHRCLDDADPDALVIPQFSWRIVEDTLTLTDLTLGATQPDIDFYWWKQSNIDSQAVEISVSDLLDMDGGPGSRYMHLWLHAHIGEQDLWAYAYAAPGQTSGRSTPFVPRHPQ